MIAELEGFSGTAYQSGSQWYIGYGTSCGADEYPDGITREEALELLRDELSGFSTSLSAWAKDNGVHLSQTQFDAMLSFTYNLGRGWMTTDCSLVDLLLDNVEGSVLRVRYYASKVTRDLRAVQKEEAVSIRIVPEVQRVPARGRLHLKAAVYGCDDREVLWSVKDKNGGSIDQNGLYQAPDERGTYEIVAASRYNPEVKVSAFVIVEE